MFLLMLLISVIRRYEIKPIFQPRKNVKLRQNNSGYPHTPRELLSTCLSIVNEIVTIIFHDLKDFEVFFFSCQSSVFIKSLHFGNNLKKNKPNNFNFSHKI